MDDVLKYEAVVSTLLHKVVRVRIGYLVCHIPSS